MTSLSLDKHDSITDGSVRRVSAALLSTSDHLTPTLLRIALGVVMLPHGLQKTVGWFGGYGFNATLTGLGLPLALAFLVILAESAGAIALITGFMTRVAAFGIGAVMVGAALIAHRAHFFMNWSGTQGGEGFEYHILAASIALALMIVGGGRFSVDRAITR